MFYDKYLQSKNKKTAIMSRLILFAIIFGISLTVFYYLFSLINFASAYSFILSFAFNNGYYVAPFDAGAGFYINAEQINIQDVCTGWFELAVFISLIIATIDVYWKKRLCGVLILIPLFFLFNFTRIYLIILALLYLNYNIVDVFHTILFKAGLFIFFGIYYYFWLKISTNGIDTK